MLDIESVTHHNLGGGHASMVLLDHSIWQKQRMPGCCEYTYPGFRERKQPYLLFNPL